MSIYLLFGDRVLCGLGWPGTHCVARMIQTHCLTGEIQSLGWEVGTGGSEVKADPASLSWLDHGASAHSRAHPGSKLSVDLAPSLFLSLPGCWPRRKPTNWRAALRAGKGDFPCWRPHLWRVIETVGAQKVWTICGGSEAASVVCRPAGIPQSSCVPPRPAVPSSQQEYLGDTDKNDR